MKFSIGHGAKLGRCFVHVGLVLGLLALASCGGQPSFSKLTASANRTDLPAIGLVGVEGVPDEFMPRFRKSLVDAFDRRGMKLVMGNFAGELELTGQIGSLPVPEGHQIQYDWRLLATKTGEEIQRTTGQEISPGERAYGAVAMARIAEATAETLASRFVQAGFAVGSAGMPPPPDAFVRAGPEAEKQIDYETLLGPGQQGPLADADLANQDGDAIPVPMPKPRAGTQVALSQPQPDMTAKAQKAVAIRKIYLPAIEGDQTRELHVALARILKAGGWPVIDSPAADALQVRGKLVIAPPKGASQLVALEWIVARPDGSEAGRVNQSNQVPAHSLDNGWGETAQYAAEAAADGMAQLVQSLR